MMSVKCPVKKLLHRSAAESDAFMPIINKISPPTGNYAHDALISHDRLHWSELGTVHRKQATHACMNVEAEWSIGLRLWNGPPRTRNSQQEDGP